MLVTVIKRRLTTAGLVFALILLVYISFVTYHSNSKFLVRARWVNHTHTVINQINLILSELEDAESAQQGYLITGDENFLVGYNKAIVRFPKDLQTLGLLTQDNPAQQRSIENISADAHEKSRILQLGIDKIRTFGWSGQHEIAALTQQNRVLMDQIRDQLQTMVNVEEQLLAERVSIEAKDSIQTKEYIVLGNSAAIALLLFTFYLLAREIKSRELAQREAEKNAKEIEDIYNYSPFAYHSVNAQGLIIRMNATALSWLGYEHDEVVGKKLHPELMTPESARCFWQTFFPLFKTQGWLKDVEFDYVRKDGSVFRGCLTATAIYDKNGQYLLSRSNVYDITERKKAELQIQQLNQQLEQHAQQLQNTNKELESFSYSVSHDLRSPLRAIDGYSRIFEEDFGDQLEDEGRRLLTVVRENSKKMGQLIDDLLSFSKLGRTPMGISEVDMEALVSEVWHEINLGEKKTASQLHIGTLPKSWADRALIKQVVINLLSNGLKYSSTKDISQIDVYADEDAGEVIYSFCDNGVGFDMRYYNKLFGVFQRLHTADEFAGTGVGLAIVHRIITRHGGRVWAQSQLDKGSAFSFSLPKKDNK